MDHGLRQPLRHALGAHYTSEVDIMRVVLPTIVTPFQARIDAAKTQSELHVVMDELSNFKVLDPACGSGNFLYVAYRELKRLEAQTIIKLRSIAAPGTRIPSPQVSVKQIYGLEFDSFGVALAKVTLTLAKELAIRELRELLGDTGLDFDYPLPLDNLEDNIIEGDALFMSWPRVDAIIGNPPFQSKNKITREMGIPYVTKLRDSYPEISGMADYCVYWLRKTHDHLLPGQRAGLVGTNTIRENYSREGGLDYIVWNGGTITNAVSRAIWSGDAAVNVSIVNWIKENVEGEFYLTWQIGDKADSPWYSKIMPFINSSLSPDTDVTQAHTLKTNSNSPMCKQGQTHGHQKFTLTGLEAAKLINDDPSSKEAIFPYLIGVEMITSSPTLPQKFVIDFRGRDIFSAKKYKGLIARIEKNILPDREKKAEAERDKNQKALGQNQRARVNWHHKNFLNQWWLLSYGRLELINELSKIERYVVCVRATKRPIFVFVSSKISPNDSLQVFPVEDDYSFGIIQSEAHWRWYKARCSTLKGEWRYTSNTVFDSFPWPQSPTSQHVRAVASAVVELCALRNKVMKAQGWSLRDLYRTLDTPGKNPLRDAQEKLDVAVRAAYGMKAGEDVLAFLLALNGQLADAETIGKTIMGPGLPAGLNPADYTTTDAVRSLGTSSA